MPVNDTSPRGNRAEEHRDAGSVKPSDSGWRPLVLPTLHLSTLFTIHMDQRPGHWARPLKKQQTAGRLRGDIQKKQPWSGGHGLGAVCAPLVELMEFMVQTDARDLVADLAFSRKLPITPAPTIPVGS